VNNFQVKQMKIREQSVTAVSLAHFKLENKALSCCKIVQEEGLTVKREMPSTASWLFSINYAWLEPVCLPLTLAPRFRRLQEVD